MKKILTLVASALCTLPMFAAINTMNYQAVINDADGKPVAQKTIGLKFTLQSDDTPAQFVEETQVATNSDGLVVWQIGSKSSDGISGVDWSADGLTLRVDVDLNGDGNYTTSYTSSIQSVPTAFYSIKSADTEEVLHRVLDLQAWSEAQLASLQASIYDVITDLNNHINELNIQILELRTQLDILKAENNELRQNIESLKVQIAENQNRITNLETIVSGM